MGLKIALVIFAVLFAACSSSVETSLRPKHKTHSTERYEHSTAKPQKPYSSQTGKTIRYETEEAHVIGVAQVSSERITGRYSGSGFVNFPTNAPEFKEGTLVFTVNIPADNKYSFTIAYASPVESFLSVKINGIEDVVSSLPASSTWSTKVESVFFRQGLNSVILRGVKMSAPLNVDYVEIQGAIDIAVRGATLPYFELEAENATFNGKVIGPDRTLYNLPTEASQRMAVQITQGQWVEFTLTASANALVVRFSIPDTSNGAGQVAGLNVLIDGTYAFNLTVTSIYSWQYGEYPFSKNPSQGKPRHFYDETRGLFGKTLQSGQKVRLVATNSITYTIDLADFYTVPDPYPMPSGFLSVTDNGADPTGKKDSTQAFQTTLNAGSNQNKGVWIPQGLYLVNQRFTLDKITVRGAGPWYSTVQATVDHGVGFFAQFAPQGSHDVQLYDFAMIGDTNVRDDGAVDSGCGGGFNGNSIAQNLWIEHTKCGMWLDGPFDGFHIMGTTIRNTYADGINLHKGVSNVVIEQCILRNTADDGLAIWSEQQADTKNVFKFNTIQIPVLANGIALYGGTDNAVTDNYVQDTICDGVGLHVGNRYNSVSISGNTVLARNTLVRCGAPSRFGPWTCGSIWFWEDQGPFQGTVTASDIVSTDSTDSAITFWTGTYNGNVVISNITVNGGPYVMSATSAGGNVPCDHVVANGLTQPYGGVHSCAALVFDDKGGNTGWDLNHDHQHCN